MRIAIDIDDTITRCPAFFSLVSRSVLAAGHEVIILTYREDREQTESDLDEWGIAYDELVMASSIELDRTGFFEWKPKVCRDRRIDILFEDMPEVINGLDESTVAFMPVDRTIGKVTYLEANFHDSSGPE